MLYAGQMLIVNTRIHPTRIAVADKRQKLTYQELNKESNRIAHTLKLFGIDKGSKVALLMDNSVEWVVIWYACQKIGAVMVPLHGWLKSKELARQLNLTNCILLMYTYVYEYKMKEIVDLYDGFKQRICIGSTVYNDVIRWDTLSSELDDTEAQIMLGNNDPALILFTSGTTGESKGVVRTQEMLALHAMSLAVENCGADKHETMITSAKLYHAGGIVCLLKMAVLGGTLVLADKIVPTEMLDLIERYHTTQIMMLPPNTYERLYQYGEWRNSDYSFVNEVCLSAGKCTYEYAMHIFEMFPKCYLYSSWGSTETCSVTGMRLFQEELQTQPDCINSIGKANALMEIRIVDNQGIDVLPGKVGEALVRSPMVVSGYLTARENDKHIFLENGWFRTGDLLRKDEATGCYYFMDRKKDMIKSGGENIYALEIERVIQTHPAVLDCAVVGIPDKQFEEGVAAAIVLRPGLTLTGSELIEHCKESLPSFMKPRYMGVVDRLPVNSVGKVEKHILREHAGQYFTSIKA